MHIAIPNSRYSRIASILDTSKHTLRACSALLLFAWENKNSVQLNFFFPTETVKISSIPTPTPIPDGAPNRPLKLVPRLHENRILCDLRPVYTWQPRKKKNLLNCKKYFLSK